MEKPKKPTGTFRCMMRHLSDGSEVISHGHDRICMKQGLKSKNPCGIIAKKISSLSLKEYRATKAV